MHDTALEIGRLALETYCAPSPDILELGSLNVNGSLRSFAPADARYLGVDFEHGPGVDIVVRSGEPLPFDDESFDLVLASSVLEHDPAFWSTFLEMCRKARPGGYIYINVPSNGAVHRYPDDNWRFYPDSGKALARWASSQGLQTKLIESFTAPRQQDIWNDFVAVFRKGPTRKRLPQQLLHTQVAGSMNIQIDKANAFLNPKHFTEDMDLIDKAQADALNKGELVTRLEDSLSEYGQRLALIETTQKESEQKLRAAETQLLALQEQASTVAMLQRDLAQEQAKRYDLQTLVDQKSAQAEKDEESRRALAAELANTEARLAERFSETAFLMQLLREQPSTEQQDNDWLRQVFIVQENTRWWWRFMPRKWQNKRLHSRLAQRGLFNAADYLKRYPDIAAEGMDPLRHYILHGASEGRKI